MVGREKKVEIRKSVPLKQLHEKLSLLFFSPSLVFNLIGVFDALITSACVSDISRW